ncbi:MAG: tRNA pseudouridine(38-40) synthase TruA [Bacteroidales bacterium]|nr:tRNA pseudouridine(38-40) synthase TruA [Bacteroidales bacterium]
MRYFMRLSYRGLPFHGWQSQPGAVTVQATIEQAMATALRLPEMRITGAGRTDTGVNARMMVAHFDVEHPLCDIPRLLHSLNTLVGPDIALEDIYPVEATAHARFDATSRTYHYYALERKSPFFYLLSWKAPKGLDYDKMNEAAQQLLTTQDFTSFAKLHADTKTNICHVTHAAWHPVGDDGHVFVITADRFLRNMVRAVVGTLVEVGRGKLSLEGFADVIAQRNRCAAGTSMPPQALYLWDIKY